jgi:prolyl oligopeptidase
MKKILLCAPLFFLLACSNREPVQKFEYPESREVDTFDIYFGKKIKDPYRWLEDDNSAETKQWVDAQNQISFGYLEKIPFRNKIKERLTQIWNFEKLSAPFRKGDYYFFYKNDGIQNQSVLYVQNGLNAEPRVLLDPNKLSADGTVSLSGISFSKDAKYMAYGISRAGSDWREWYVLETETGNQLSDKLEWIKFSSAAWYENGFFYSRYEKPKDGETLKGKNTNNRLYYHKIGDPQEKDILILEDKENPGRSFGAQVTDNEKHLIVYVTESTSGQRLLYKSMNKKGWNFSVLVPDFNNEYGVIDADDSKLLVVTNKNAPMSKLVELDPLKPGEENWKTIIPEKAQLLDAVYQMGDKLVAKYQIDVSHHLFIHNRKGDSLGTIPVGGLATVNGFNGHKKDSLAFFSVVSFTSPGTIYKYNIQSGTSEIYRAPKIDFDGSQYETKQVFFTSKDGTRIPMFITHKKGIKLDGQNPCFLFGYGGFNISLTPEFRIDRAIFLENGGVYALANLRGGGEYGEEWHKSGTKCNKQNVFDDFMAAADFLVEQKYTSHQLLAIHGRSNGGLLVGAVMTQRPEIAKVALPVVGVLDMLRYQYFTIGRYWAVDYGTSENKEEFECLLKYSPLHNVKPAAYPATLIMTADHDDRVVPAHSFKFAATLQKNQTGNDPVLIRIDVNAGHGAGKPTSMQIAEFADMWAFVFFNLGMSL